MDCVFCRVLQNDINKQIIIKGNNVTAIKKPYTSKNVNFLIITNSHIINLKDYTPERHKEILSEIVEMANLLASKSKESRDWSMTINNGSKSNQTVFHLHAHISSNDSWSSWFY